MDISEKEMIKTFNCGIGFCLIVNLINLKRLKFFIKKYEPYVIGKIKKGNGKVKLNGNIKWV